MKSRRHFYFDSGVELAFYYESTTCYILCIQIDRMFRSCWSMKKVSYFSQPDASLRRANYQRGRIARSTRLPVHSPKIGATPISWQASRFLVQSEDARARKVVYFRTRFFSSRYEIIPRPSAFEHHFSEEPRFGIIVEIIFALVGRNVWFSIVRNRVKWYISIL